MYELEPAGAREREKEINLFIFVSKFYLTCCQLCCCTDRPTLDIIANLAPQLPPATTGQSIGLDQAYRVLNMCVPVYKLHFHSSSTLRVFSSSSVRRFHTCDDGLYGLRTSSLFVVPRRWCSRASVSSHTLPRSVVSLSDRHIMPSRIVPRISLKGKANIVSEKVFQPEITSSSCK